MQLTPPPRRPDIGRLVQRLRGEMLAAITGELNADERLGRLRVSSMQLVILALMAPEGGTTAADVCKAMSYGTAAMSRLVERLARKGLIRRLRNCKDRRRVTLELTDEGRAVLARMWEICTRVTDRILRGFTREEIRQLERLLGRAIEHSHIPRPWEDAETA
jgi:DNA-binding MarR family transcriptional regulator